MKKKKKKNVLTCCLLFLVVLTEIEFTKSFLKTKKGGECAYNKVLA